jgi:hypothetical protein
MVGCLQAWRFVRRLGWTAMRHDPVQIRKDHLSDIDDIYSKALMFNELRIASGVVEGVCRGGPPT